jgi:hypothetical protein
MLRSLWIARHTPVTSFGDVGYAVGDLPGWDY